MSPRRRAAFWALTLAFASTLAAMVTGAADPEVDTTTTTTWFSGPGDLTEVRP